MDTQNRSRQVASSTRALAFAMEGLKLFGIALGCLVVLGGVTAISVKTGLVIPKRWIGLCAWTGLLIWFICKQCIRHLRAAKFWVTFLSLLLLHMMASIAVLQRLPELGLGWFALIFIVEAPIMVLTLETVTRGKRSRKQITALF